LRLQFRPAAILICMLAASGSGLSAQTPDSARADAVLRMGELRVHGARPLTTVGGASGVEVTKDSLRLSAAPTLAELLREVPMLHVRTNSRGETELLARGSESRQVAVLVDGVPLTLGWDGRTDAAALPATALDEVRFSRGLASMLHGPNVLGGVIELSIAGEHADPPRALSIVSGFDEAGGLGGSAVFTLPHHASSGSLLLRGGAGFRDTQGVPLARGVTEPVRGARPELRVNTDAQSADAFAAARYRAASGAWLSASSSHFRGARGIAAELSATAPRFWRYPHIDRTVAVLSGGTGFHRTPFGGTGDLEFSVGYDVGRTEIVAFRDRTYTDRIGFENGDGRTLTARLLGDHTLGHNGDLRAAITLADVRHDEAIPSGTFRYRQQLWSAGAESAWRVAATAGPLREVRASVGGAYDIASMPETGGKPAAPDVHAWGARAGVSALAHPRASVHAGISRRARFPALREAFSGALDRFAPNPDLAPERLTALEAGTTVHFGGAQLQIVAFAHNLDDAIVRIALPDRRFMRVNENAVRSRGVELLAGWQLGSATVGGDVTLQSATLVTPAERRGFLENQPEVFGSLHARARFPLALSAGATAAYTGRQFCLSSSGENVRLDAGTRISGDLRRQWSLRSAGALLSRIEARLAVDNATDSATWDQCGLPQPGRLASFQLRVF
jgi:iron complex outermembrane recepter protein